MVNFGQQSGLCVPRDPNDGLSLLSVSPDRAKPGFNDPIVVSITEKLESQNEHALWGSCKELRSPIIGHPSVQGQPTSSGMHAIGDLDDTNVKRVISFHSPNGGNRGGAVDLNLIFSVVKKLDPLVGWKPHWVRDLVIQVGKWPLSRMNTDSYSASMSSISSSILQPQMGICNR